MSVWDIIVRITLSFIVLFTMARIMGRKEISQMTFFNFVSAIAIGSITATLATSQFLSLRNGVIALVGWTIFTLAMDMIDIKSKGARKVTTGTPLVVIKDGQIMKPVLAKARLDLDTLNTMLRQKNIFQIEDVEYAIFETNGKLSVMKKENKKPVTKGDMNILNPSPNVYPMTTQVISDGRVDSNNLTKLNLDQQWLEQQLQQQGIDRISDVFYAEVQKDGSLHVHKGDIVH